MYGFSHFPKISIHTPHAGSDVGILHLMHRAFDISIHTPHAGSDFSVPLSQHPFPDFNPHSPCGERLPPEVSPSTPFLFQSTLPMRGATFFYLFLCIIAIISIHTPHAGSDKHKQYMLIRPKRFQSTLPMRGATISCFQHCPNVCGFQSTLPMRGATKHKQYMFIRPKRFQSTLPMRGATPTGPNDLTNSYLFQSTLPMRGATFSFGLRLPISIISIHTPHAGSDCTYSGGF